MIIDLLFYFLMFYFIIILTFFIYLNRFYGILGSYDFSKKQFLIGNDVVGLFGRQRVLIRNINYFISEEDEEILHSEKRIVRLLSKIVVISTLILLIIANQSVYN